MSAPQIILASGSKARQDMLRDANIEFDIVPADIDEAALKTAKHDATPTELARELAKAKALHVSAQNTGAVVIGSDQILVCEGEVLSKATSIGEARIKLQNLRGKTHHLISAVCVIQANAILFEYSDQAALTMHNFDDAYLDDYIGRAGWALTACVGAYALEEHGKDLFAEITGDYHVILGMPLAPLLDYLKKEHHD